MFKKTKKAEAGKAKVEKLNKNELNNVVGGGASLAPATPTPVPVNATVVYENFDYKK